MNLTKKILYALVLGVIAGLIFNQFFPTTFELVNSYALVPLGSLFVKLVKMLVVPIVFFSITLGAAGLGDPKKLGRIGGKSILFFLTTTAIAITVAILLALTFKPGSLGNFDIQGATYEVQNTAPSFVDTLLNIIPENILQSAAAGNMLQVIFFSVLIGLGVALLGDKVKTFKVFLEEGNLLMMKLVNIVMLTAPIGAFSLIASSIGAQGFNAMKAMIVYMFVIILTLVIHTIVVYGGAVTILGKRNPIEFFKKFFPAMVVGFSTSSSNATLPLAMKTAQDSLNVPKHISSFVQPLGATINMDGTAIMQGVATIFIAQAFDVQLTLSQMAIIVLTAVLASIGTAGVPGVGLIMLAMVLEQVGLPVEGIGLVIGVDRLLDMLRTSVNVTGDAVCAIVVSESEKKHEPKKSNKVALA